MRRLGGLPNLVVYRLDTTSRKADSIWRGSVDSSTLGSEKNRCSQVVPTAGHLSRRLRVLLQSGGRATRHTPAARPILYYKYCHTKAPRENSAFTIPVKAAESLARSGALSTTEGQSTTSSHFLHDPLFTFPSFTHSDCASTEL